MGLRLARCLCGPRVHAAKSRPYAHVYATDASRRRAGRADPTGTLPIVRRWSSDLDRRWTTIKRMLPSSIAARLDPVNHVTTSYLTGQPDPVIAFQGWLDEAMRQVVLGINGAWLLPYVRQASDAGALHARQTSVARDSFDPDQPRDDHGRWAVSAYVEYSETLNSSLRSGGVSNDKTARMTSALDRMMRPMHLGTLYRGVGGDLSLKPGDTFVDKGFTSASRDKNVAWSFAEGTGDGEEKWRLYINGATHGLEGSAEQKEVILPRGTTYHVSEVLRKGGVNTAWLDVVKRGVIKDADPAPQDRTGVLQSLAITELQGIMEAVSQQCVRAFGDAIMTRRPQSSIAVMRRIVENVGSRRSQLLVSFIVVRAFNAAALDGFRARGVTRVGLIPERTPVFPIVTDAKSLKGQVNVLTAEDDRVCPECEEIAADGPYYLDEAEKLIPAHPRCRCAFVPADEEEYAEVFGEDSATHIAAGVMITADNTGRTLFIRRSSGGDHAGEWAFPAGAVEPGETMEQAAQRETLEEIGYVPDLDDLDHHERRELNGVDFTTFSHVTPTEFRPDLNHEHSAYKWAYPNETPQPLHPGVHATLFNSGGRVIDADWDENKHPRDKDGKFTEAGGSSSTNKINHPTEAVTLAKVMEKQGAEFTHYKPENKSDTTTHVYTAKNKQSSRIVENVLKKGGYEYTTFQPSVEAHGVKGYKVKVSETYSNTVNEMKSALGAPPPPLETKPAEHPLQKHLASVQGTSAERVALRKQIQAATFDTPELQKLKEKHNASFWKEHQTLVKQGKTEKAADIASKLDKYSKSYGIENPLKQTSSASTSSPIKITTGVFHPGDKPAPTYTPQSLPEHGALDFKSLKQVGEQKGSNPGGVYEDAKGQRYYIKTMDEAHAKNELLAAKLYALAHAPTLEYVPVAPEGDKHFVATKMVELSKNNISQFTATDRQQAQKHFAVHAWLANWDAAGTGGDNQGVPKGSALPRTLDVGGALEYRAKGSPKGAAFGTSVEEFDTLRKSSNNPDSVKLFGSMTDEQIRDSTRDAVDGVTVGKITEAVGSVYGSNSPKTKELVDKLVARRDDLIARANALGKAPAAPDLSHLDEEGERMYWLKKTVGSGGSSAEYWAKPISEYPESKQKKLKEYGLTPAETGFIRAFTGPESGVNREMRDGFMNDHVFAFKHIMNDALDKLPVYEGDKVWRKINLDEKQLAMYQPGKIVHWQAFSSTSKNSGTWSGNTQFIIHNPKSGRDVQFISANPSEAEVIMPADTYYRVLSKKGSTIELEEVLPFGKKKKKAA